MAAEPVDGAPVLLLHGGAGVTPGRDYSEVEAHLVDVATGGRVRLEAGASALDVVEWAVAQLEASGLYVAGRGACPNRAGWYEFDACIMDGAAPRAGAVAAIRDVESPVAAARAVLDHTPHVLLAGEGATLFARERGLPAITSPEQWFRLPVGVTAAEMLAEGDALSHGTVGAVALDLRGRLAAATSTGGVFGKRAGRVGDTPIPGAGTWADGTVAASCTGIGEHFILAGGTAEVAARMRLLGEDVESASSALLDRVKALGGNGGIIALDHRGRAAIRWNSGGMKHAIARAGRDVFSGIGA